MIARVAILTDDPGWHGARLREALANRGVSSEWVSLRQCRLELAMGAAGVVMPGFEELPDGVFVRGVPGGTLEQVVFYLNILHGLQKLGVCVYNDGRAIERSVDKGMTSFLLYCSGIPTPASWVLEEGEALQSLLGRELKDGQELVLKPLFGSQGKGLLRISDPSGLPAADHYNGVYYLQRFIDTGDSPHDWRVFVVGGRARVAMRRSGTGWISNRAQGGCCYPAVLDAELRELAERSAAILGLNYAGVDILRDRSGQAYVIEVNSIPAWKGLQAVSPIDVAAMLVDDFLDHCPSRGAIEAVG
ncbi:MAG: RimK family alpha-L-glutamate ligase [Gammaproteobacteria bacterium]|nr:RimK family alpha-L-glutamate ligase [Gammaproteobacteria bacterium]